jgi:hypothetical protein
MMATTIISPALIVVFFVVFIVSLRRWLTRGTAVAVPGHNDVIPAT